MPSVSTEGNSFHASVSARCSKKTQLLPRAKTRTSEKSFFCQKGLLGTKKGQFPSLEPDGWIQNSSQGLSQDSDQLTKPFVSLKQRRENTCLLTPVLAPKIDTTKKENKIKNFFPPYPETSKTNFSLTYRNQSDVGPSPFEGAENLETLAETGLTPWLWLFPTGDGDDFWLSKDRFRHTKYSEKVKYHSFKFHCASGQKRSTSAPLKEFLCPVCILALNRCTMAWQNHPSRFSHDFMPLHTQITNS